MKTELLVLTFFCFETLTSGFFTEVLSYIFNRSIHILVFFTQSVYRSVRQFRQGLFCLSN